MGKKLVEATCTQAMDVEVTTSIPDEQFNTSEDSGCRDMMEVGHILKKITHELVSYFHSEANK